MAFEHLRAIQPRMADELERTSRDGMMPQSVLFSGVPGSGRLTAALEEAFSLTGENEELLSSERIAYFASRPFRPELRAASELFLRQRNDFSRRFFIRTVRRILLQYHSSIASLHKESAGVKSRLDIMEGEKTVFAAASAADELLLSIERSGEYDGSVIEKTVEAISQLMTDSVLAVGKKTAGATIDEIRAIQDWLSEGTEEKAVIFENAEDYTEGAKNSLLKLLEEPPMHAHLILVSAHPGRLLETILSRVRKFTFPELTPEAVSAFIARCFMIHGRFSSFDEFFFREGSGEDEKSAMDGYISDYASALTEGRRLSDEREEEIFSGLERMDGFRYFRERLVSSLQDGLSSGKITPGRAALIWRALSSSLDSADTYNMSIRHALDLALREVADVR